MQVHQPNNMGMPPQQDHQVQSQLFQQFQQFQKQNIPHDQQQYQQFLQFQKSLKKQNENSMQVKLFKESFYIAVNFMQNNTEVINKMVR